MKILISVTYLFVNLFFVGNEKKNQASSYYQSEPITGLNLGNKAPEIELQITEGKTLKLSSLKGKLVLIDFWASWCGPCRFENKNLVKCYQNFKDKKFRNGDTFTVFSISLDMNKTAWIKAIEADELTWPNHVTDFEGWNSKAVQAYKIISIPSNLLLNAEGVIINKNLKSAELNSYLQKLVINS